MQSWLVPQQRGYALLAAFCLPTLLLPQELDLSHNALVSLPGAISSLASLTALRLSHNQLSSLPQELAALRSLVLFDARWGAGEETPAATRLSFCSQLMGVSLTELH